MLEILRGLRLTDSANDRLSVERRNEGIGDVGESWKFVTPGDNEVWCTPSDLRAFGYALLDLVDDDDDDEDQDE